MNSADLDPDPLSEGDKGGPLYTKDDAMFLGVKMGIQLQGFFVFVFLFCGCIVNAADSHGLFSTIVGEGVYNIKSTGMNIFFIWGVVVVVVV